MCCNDPLHTTGGGEGEKPRPWQRGSSQEEMDDWLIELSRSEGPTHRDGDDERLADSLVEMHKKKGKQC